MKAGFLYRRMRWLPLFTVLTFVLFLNQNCSGQFDAIEEALNSAGDLQERGDDNDGNGPVPALTNWSLENAVQRTPGREMPFGQIEKFDLNNYSDLIFEESLNDRAQILRRVHTTANCYSGGCARFDVRPGYRNEGDTGIIINHQNGQRINVGYMIYFGRDWVLTMRGSSHKHVLVYDDISNGGRNIRPMVAEQSVTDNNNNYVYRTFNICNNAAGICADEFNYHFPAVGPNTNHSFKFEDYLEQWLYVEVEIEIGGINKLYIWNRNGTLRHRIGFCDGGMTREGFDCRNINVPEQPLDYTRILAYFGNRPNNPITEHSYVLIDNIRVNNTFMGPPAGFIQGR